MRAAQLSLCLGCVHLMQAKYSKLDMYEDLLCTILCAEMSAFSLQMRQEGVWTSGKKLKLTIVRPVTIIYC